MDPIVTPLLLTAAIGAGLLWSHSKGAAGAASDLPPPPPIPGGIRRGGAAPIDMALPNGAKFFVDVKRLGDAQAAQAWWLDTKTGSYGTWPNDFSIAWISADGMQGALQWSPPPAEYEHFNAIPGQLYQFFDYSLLPQTGMAKIAGAPAYARMGVVPAYARMGASKSIRRRGSPSLYKLAQNMRLASTRFPRAARVVCGPGGAPCLMREPRALNDRLGRFRATSFIPSGSLVTLLGTGFGSMLLSTPVGVAYAPQAWVYARFVAPGGFVHEGWMFPEAVQ
jgi:hypothetical protein